MGVKFFRKNRIDLSFSQATITITDATATDNGQDFVNFLRNRDNTSGWATTGSNDAANTQVDVDLVVGRKDINSIILVGHNFSDYTIQYYNANTSSWTDFSTPINVSGNTTDTTFHNFDTVSTDQIRLIITGTMTADDDKFLRQFIITESLGEFTVQPEIQPVIDRSRKTTKYLSGKSHIIRSVEAFDVRIRKKNVTSDPDLALVETLHDNFEGFLVWLSGGTENQYDTIRKGWRLEDIYLMNIRNEQQIEWDESRFKNGMEIDLRLVEVN